MPTNHATIKAALLSLYNTAKTAEMSETDFADGMATIIQNAILSGEVLTDPADPFLDSLAGAVTGQGIIQ
ncbi:MAG: hypothetical protein GWP06_00350 [Actinobacteria bacterium]|nr:hypothetical protein [Actinomycetota bacterium]